MISFSTDNVNTAPKLKIVRDINSVAKALYKNYMCIDGIIFPAGMESIQSPELFTKSLMLFNIWQDYPWLNNVMLDPAEVGHAIKSKPIELFEDDNGIRKSLNKSSGDEVIIKFGTVLTQDQINDTSKYIGLISMQNLNLNDYATHWHLPKDIGKSLLDKNMHTVDLGNGITAILNRQLIPGLKQAVEVDFYTKPIEGKIHELLIVSRGYGWTTYSKHNIIDLPEEV